MLHISKLRMGLRAAHKLVDNFTPQPALRLFQMIAFVDRRRWRQFCHKDNQQMQCLFEQSKTLCRVF